MYSFYLSGSGNGNHGAASKNRIIICNSTHAVAVDRMVINISISSLSWIFKQHYRDSSRLKIARQYCIWALVLRNTLSHAHTERISMWFFSCTKLKMNICGTQETDSVTFRDLPPPRTATNKSTAAKSWAGCSETRSNAWNSKHTKARAESKNILQGKKQTWQ